MGLLLFISFFKISFLVEMCSSLVKICYFGLTGKEKEFSIGVPGEMWLQTTFHSTEMFPRDCWSLPAL